MKKKLIIGSRGSDLALWQANYVLSRLKKLGLDAVIKVIKTKGDEIQHLGFDKMEGKGFFTKEIEEALKQNEIDLAVHSYKDMETNNPKELAVAAVITREEPNDLLVINRSAVDPKRALSLKEMAKVGTSSSRRKSQVLAFRNDLEVSDLRGNVTTRIQKLKDGAYDAIVLAAAGINRLNLDLSGFHVEQMDPCSFIPAPAQGTLAIQIRKKDKELAMQLKNVHDDVSGVTSDVERKILHLFDGGCLMPLGVYCTKDEDERFHIWVAKANSGEKPPAILHLVTNNPDEAPARIVQKFKQITPCSVFITRNLRRDDYFANVLKGNGFVVEGNSLIETKKVEISKTFKAENINWIFFSSKQAIDHFFAQAPNWKNVKYGVIGKETAAILRKRGLRADFIGYSTDTKLTGRQFAAAVGSGKVLFPQARGSMKTVQQQFTQPGQTIDLVVYETISHEDTLVPETDIILFTSPSNVKAFFKNHRISPEKKVIAMGKATANELKKNGLKRSFLPASFNDAGLAAAVFEASINNSPYAKIR